MNRLVVAIAAMVSLSTAAFAIEHPSTAYQPRPVREGYDNGTFGFPPEWSFGSVVYHAHPQAETLNLAERYMLFGTEENSRGEALGPWWDVVFQLVAAYDRQHGQIPSVLDIVELRRIRGLENLQESDLTARLVRSPISGEYPSLDSENFSAGNLFIRRITQEEIEGLAEHDLNLRLLYFQRKFLHNSRSGSNRPARLTSPVYYIKIYGDEGVIESRHAASFKFEDGRSQMFIPE